MFTNNQTNLLHLPEYLSAKIVGSFAHKTVTVRFPLILEQVIGELKYNYLSRERPELPSTKWFGVEGKSLEHLIKQLKLDIKNDSPFLELISYLPDTDLWNQYLKRQRSNVNGRFELITWSQVALLYAESFMYRRLREIFISSQHFQTFDPFARCKQKLFNNSIELINNLSKCLHDRSMTVEKLFHFYLMNSLWADSYDVSLSNIDNYDQLESLKSKIIVNDYIDLWKYLKNINETKINHTIRIDLILENEGYELFTDLCLIEYCHHSNILPRNRTKCYLHVKPMSLFPFDITNNDIFKMFEKLDHDSRFNIHVKKLCERFRSNLQDHVWNIVNHNYWSCPHDYSEMSQFASDLYAQMEQSDLVIFKGDRNYRKLMSDRCWSTNTPFKVALSNFQPHTAICSLRTIKTDIIVGVQNENSDQILETITSLQTDFMETGQYSVIHFWDNH